MAGFINWNNMGSITDTSDAIDEREQAYEPVQFDSNSWTNIGIAKQRAITPAAPTAYEQRKSSLEEATERNKAILGDKLAQDAQKRDELLIASGADENQVNQNRQIQTEIKNKDSLERIQNHIASKSDPLNKVSFFDEDLENAIHNLSRNEVIELYAGKPELRDYILSQQGYASNQLAKTGLYSNSAASVFGNLASVGLGAAGEEAALIDWANYTAKSLTGSSESDKTKAITEGLSNKLNNLSDEYRNTSARLSDEATAARQELTDWEYDKKIAQQKINGLRGSEVNQDTIGRELSKVKDVLSDGYQVTKEIAQEVPSTIATLGVAKGVTSGAKTIAKAASKDKIKSNLAKKEAQYIAEQKAKTELTEDAIKATPEFAKAQEVAKKNIDAVFARKSQKHSGKIITGWETVSSGAQNAVPAYSDAASFILNQDDKSFKESKGFKDLQKENPDITVDDAKQVLANRAGEEAMLRAFFSSATLGAAFSNAERKLFDRLFKGKSLATIKERAKSFGISVGSNAAQEFGEEASSKLFSNLAINNALGYKAVDESRDVLSSGLYGAITGGATTTLTNSPELIGAGAKKLAKVAGDKITQAAEKSTAKMQAKQVEAEAKENQSLFGTSSYKDKDGNTVAGQKGVLGKDFDESNIGKSYKEAIDTLGKSSTVLQEVIDNHGKENYTQVIHALYQGYANARKALENPDKLSKEQVEGYTALKDAYEAFQVKLSQGAVKDLADYNNDLYSAISDMHMTNADPNATTEQKQAAVDKVNELAGKDEGFQKLTKSTLYSMLSTDRNQEYEEVQQMPKDVSFLDGKDKKDYPEVYNAVSRELKDISTALHSGQISEEEAYTKYSDALTKISVLKDTDTSTQEKLLGTRALLEEMRSSLNSIGKDFGDHSPFKLLLDELNKWTPSESESDYSVDDVILQKFFGSQGVGAYSKGYKLGLLDYVTDYFNAKKTGTEFHSLARLQRFFNTQVDKVSALTDMINQMKTDDAAGKLKPEYSYKTKYTTLSGDINRFTSIKSAERYLELAMGDMEGFNKIAQSLLQGTARNHTKPLAKKDSKPTSINVWHGSNENKHFSNLAIRPFTFEGKRYLSVEHAYQSLKSGSFDQDTYSKSWGEGIKHVGKLGTNKDTNFALMERLIYESFVQNPKAAKQLLDTGEAKFTHNQDKGFWKDAFPAALLNVREFLRNPPATDSIEQSSEQQNENPKVHTVTSIRKDENGNPVGNIDVVIDDSLESLAATTSKNGKRTVKIRSKISKPEFDDYIQGKEDSPTSAQKRIVFGQLESQYGIGKSELDKLIQSYADKFMNGNLSQALKRFILEYEISHVQNIENDSKVYKEAKAKNPDNHYEDADVLAVELRANTDAIVALGSALQLGDDIDTVAENLRETTEEVEQQENQSTEPQSESTPEVLLGLPYLGDVTLLKAQDSNYEMHKSYLAHIFAELNAEALKAQFGELPTEGKYTVKVPLNPEFLIQEDNPFVKVSGDTLTVDFPESIAKELIKHGFDVEQNSFGMFIQENKDYSNRMSNEAVQAMAATQVKDYSTEQGMENTRVIGELLNDGTFDHTTGEDGAFISALIPITRSISDYLKGRQTGVFNRHTRRGTYRKKSNTAVLPRFTGFNFLTNLFGLTFNEKGKPTVSIPEKVIQAFTVAIPQAIMDANNRHFHTTLEESLSGIGQISGVYNVTQELKTNYISQIDRSKAQRVDNYSVISGAKREFIKEIGSKVFEALGLKTTKATSMIQEDTIKSSLGLEAYNYMLANGMIQEYLVDVVNDSTEKTEPHVYFGFSWNNPAIMNDAQYEATRLMLGKSMKMDAKAYEDSAETLNKAFGSPIYGATLNLLNYAHSDAANAIFGDTELLHGVTLSDINEEIGEAPAKGPKAESKDVKTKLTSGHNPTLKKALQTANSVAFTPDSNMFDLYDNQPELYKVLNGAIPEHIKIDDLPITEESKDALRSRQLRVDRDFRLIDTYRGLSLGQGIKNFFDTAFRFAHKFATNGRIIFSADLNPVESKVVREMLNPVEFTLSQDENGYTTVQGTITPSFKVNKVSEPRTFEDLVELANSKRKQANDAKGFILALAQAAGVKIEKKLYQNIVEETKQKLDKYQDMVNELWKAQQQGKDYVPDLDMAYAFYNEHGTGTSRLVKTLSAFAQYQYQNVEGHDNQYGKSKRGQLNFHLYLEADGIANGFYNILKQFSTAITPAYIKAQNRTGNIGLDILAENLDKLDKLEGARTLFDSEGYDIDDMYEHIAKSMENSIKSALPAFSGEMNRKVGKYTVGEYFTPYLSNNDMLNHIRKIFGRGKAAATKYYAEIEASPELMDELEGIRKNLNSAINQTIAEPFSKDGKKEFVNRTRSILGGINTLYTYGQIILLDGVSATELGKFYKLAINGDYSQFQDENLIGSFKRSLAKLGVTPAMYGGKQKGITNQIMTNLKPQLLNYLDETMTRIASINEDSSNDDWKALSKAFAQARAIAVILGIPSPLFNDEKGYQTNTALSKAVTGRDVKALHNYSKALNDEVNNIVDYYNENKVNITRRIGNSLGTFLNDAIQEQFSEHFESINVAMNLNQALFNMFMNEFTSKFPTFIDKRNKEKGYSELQGSVGITRSEIIQLMKQMKNIPIVGTAFSDSAELIDSLVDLGNTLLKTDGSVSLDHSTNISSNFAQGSGSTAKSDKVRVYHEGTNFEAAGASINTASVPSTEAMTLHLVQQAMNRVGKAFLNVFDGLDAKYQLRDEVGIGANKNTFDVHTNTHLLEAMFQMFNRTSFDELQEKVKINGKEVFKDPALRDFVFGSMAMVKLSNPRLERGGGEGNLKAHIRLNQDLIQKYLDYRNAARLVGKRVMPMEEFFANSANQSLLQKLDDTFKIPKILQEEFSPYFENELNPDEDIFITAVRQTITSYKFMVARNYAIRQLEANDLPVIVNQFGGSNTGYFHNPELVSKQSDLVQRFIRFREKFPLLESSEALALFIQNDEELSSKFIKYRTEKYNELQSNAEFADDIEFDVSSLKTVRDLSKFLDNVDTDTIQGSVASIVSQLSRYLTALSPDSKIFTNLDDLVEEAKKVYNVDMRTTKGKNFIYSISKDTKGKYVEGVGIYINPNQGVVTMVHELLHSMTRTKFSNYYSNQRHRLTFGERQAIKTIEMNARKFTNRMLLDPEVLQGVEDLRKAAIEKGYGENNELIGATIDNVYAQHPSAKASAINFQYAFEVLPSIEGMSEATVLKFQSHVMQEFVSYGLTEADMLRELKFGSGDSIQNTLSGKSALSKRVSGVLEAHYDALRKEMANVMGINKENDATQSALFNILTSLNVLADAATYPDKYDLETLATGTSGRRNRNDTLSRIEFLVDSDATAYPEIMNRVSLFGNSAEHKDHLNELTSDLTNAIQADTTMPVELATVLNNPMDAETQDLVSNLRTSGIRMTQDEENAFVLAYAANRVAVAGNKTLEQAGYKWLEDLSAILEPSVLGLSKDTFNKVINPMRSSPNKLSYMLALVATNEDIRDKLTNFYKAKPTSLKNKVKQSLAYTSVYSKQLATSDFAKGADILMDSVKAFETKDFRSMAQAKAQLDALQEREEKLNQVARMLGDLTDSKHVEALVHAMQSGQGVHKNDMDSMFTEAMNEWINTYEKGKGRRTWIGTLVRLVVGSTSKTYQWYKAKNQNSTLLESVREKAASTIPAGIEAKFEHLSKDDKRAIDAILLPTNFHKIKNFSGVQDKEVLDILTNDSKANFEKAKVSGYIRGELVSRFGDKQGERLYNIAMWQIKGLGSLMVTKKAKTSNIKESHYIMPNTRAISNLIGVSDERFQEAVDTLASIYALDYVDAKHKAQMAKLMTEQPEAVNEMLDSVETMYAKSMEKAPNSLVGEDGFVMNHKDPMSNVKVVSPSDTETLSDLRRRGYLEKAKLPTGHLVMHTNMDDSVRFTTGMFNLTESTIMGTNLSSMMALNSKALRENKGKQTIPAKIMMAAGLNENYYDKLEQDTSRRILIDHDGNIIDTAIDLPRELENQLIPSTKNGIDAIGNYFGRVIEEDINISSNKYAVDLLRHHYAKSVSDRKYYIPFDGEYKPKGSDMKSVKMAEEINEIYKVLPAKTKQYIESTGGVMIDMREIENILGYHQASLSDFWNDKSRLPEPVQKVVRGVFEVMAGTVGYNPVKLAVGLEKGTNELASFTKDIILNRSLFIPMSNLVSNVLHLWTAGVPAKHIVPDTKEGLQLTKDYQATSGKVAQIEFLLLNHKLQPNERVKLTNELQVLKEKLAKSPIKPLVENGIFNSVTNIDIGSDADVDFTLFRRVTDKTGISKAESAVEDMIGKKLVDAALIRKGSPTHNFMVQSLDYGDFVAKYALYKHLTQRKGVPSASAMEVIRDEFVNYTMNRGREFDWTNKVGLTWFLAYKLAIQKVIFRNLRRNFLRTMTTYGLGKAIPDSDLLDKTVIEQNLLFDSSLDYQLSPSNLINGWEQYIWHNLL